MQDTINEFLDVHASIFCIFWHVASQTIQELSTELMRSPQDTPWSYNKVLPNSTRKLVKQKVEKREGEIFGGFIHSDEITKHLPNEPTHGYSTKE